EPHQDRLTPTLPVFNRVHAASKRRMGGCVRHFSESVVFVMLISILGCAVVFGQTQGTAQINGVVKDPSGAVLPGVEITATQTDTNQARDTISNETGTFVLGNLPTGPYKVEAKLPGFR